MSIVLHIGTSLTEISFSFYLAILRDRKEVSLPKVRNIPPKKFNRPSFFSIRIAKLRAFYYFQPRRADVKSQRKKLNGQEPIERSRICYSALQLCCATIYSCTAIAH